MNAQSLKDRGRMPYRTLTQSEPRWQEPRTGTADRRVWNGKADALEAAHNWAIWKQREC